MSVDWREGLQKDVSIRGLQRGEEERRGAEGKGRRRREEGTRVAALLCFLLEIQLLCRRPEE